MKTITIKLPQEEASRLELFIKKKHYPSKSEFIRNLIIEKIETRLTSKALRDINKSIHEIKEGKTISLEMVEKEYGL